MQWGRQVARCLESFKSIVSEKCGNASFFYFLSFLVSSQVDTANTKFKVFSLPIAYFTPEIDWGFGVVSLVSFRFKNESKESRVSQFQFGAAYTLRNQLLFYLPFQLT